MKSTFKLINLAILLAIANISFAQNLIKGRVVDGQSNQPIEYATVKLLDDQSQMVMGTTTDLEGNFSLKYSDEVAGIEISFIGFESKVLTEFPEMVKGIIDFGDISMGMDTEVLDEVVVRAERSTTEFRLDKKVFNVGQDLSSSGAGALEVLNNVPSVDVNIEGEISLRGKAGVQILIDGKPSVLASDGANALGSITAEMIENIEVITNPSAKYDAEGTSGIINIILKKNEKKGTNGSLSLNTGWPHNHSVGLSLNKRTQKFNLFTQVGAGYRSHPRESENINQDLIKNTKLYNDGTFYRDEQFYNIRLGTDYHLNDYNVFTLSGNFSYELEDQPSDYDYRLFENDELVRQWSRNEETEATNPKWSYELQYKRTYEDDKDHSLLISALGSRFGKDLSSDFNTTSTIGDYELDKQRTSTDYKEVKYTFNIDYARPLNDVFSVEAGAQYVLQDVSNDYAVFDFIDSDWLPNAGLTNVFDYDQDVSGVYGTASYEADKWGVKLGTRYEHTDLSTTLKTTGENNDQNYGDFFPSAHTSYKINERVSVQAGYSRRIYRPRLWHLNPFFNISNNFNIWSGNPDLQPEFSDSYELTTIFLFDEITFTAGLFHLYTTDVIERLNVYEDNVNRRTPYNIGTNQSTGVELNFKYSPSKIITLTGDINYNYFNRKGEYDDQNFDFTGDKANGKSTIKIKFPYDIDLEMTGNYRSKFKTVQTEVKANVFMNLGLRKKFNKGQTVVNIGIRDVFESRFREYEVINDDFYLYDYSQRGRFITFGVSYAFGKGEAMQYGGGGRHW